MSKPIHPTTVPTPTWFNLDGTLNHAYLLGKVLGIVEGRSTCSCKPVVRNDYDLCATCIVRQFYEALKRCTEEVHQHRGMSKEAIHERVVAFCQKEEER